MSHAEYCSKFVPAGGKVLDVGSGKGDFLRKMRSYGFDAYGVEANPERVFERVFRASAENLPFPDNHFDFVNCAEVTEHVGSPQKVFEEIYRVLRRGGKCYISFHNRCGIYDYHYHLYFINWMPRSWTEPILQFLKKQKEDGQAGRQKLITMHYYTYNQVLKILHTAGFYALDIRVEKIKKIFGIFNFLFLIFYFCLLRPFYFNTFHLLAEKSKQ